MGMNTALSECVVQKHMYVRTYVVKAVFCIPYIDLVSTYTLIVNNSRPYVWLYFSIHT